ncbi:TRAP transporter large permease [Alkalihalobacillus sp. BA299]|uniref:TRAP transporter large permease n=1 Tax=Alkalihalobacillus sp. BA299 TaxID=2815938 RepID=UPI001ADB703C|nr:TRAP transporter large permease [Alkalihalobacillus sp. BA299]
MIVSLIAILVLFLLIILQMPISFSLFIVGFAGIWYLKGFDVANSVIHLAPLSGVISSDVAALPLFILIGAFALSAGIARDGYTAARLWLGKLPGGLGVATVAASSVFAACSGSSTAGAVTMGKLAIPEMRQNRYSDTLSVGACGAGGLLASMIPPSGMMVLYGLATGESISKLLIAGIIPGAILVLAFSFGIIAIAKIKPSAAPVVKETYTWKEKFGALPKTWGVFAIFGTIFFGIFTGFFTATEAAAWGALIALILLVIRTRKGFFKSFVSSCVESASITVSLLFLVLGAYVFSKLLVFAGLPGMISSTVSDLNLSPIIIMLGILATYFILGMFLDGVTMLLLTIPIYYPIITDLGYDGLWFGVIVVAMIEVGMVSPPFGIVAYSLKSIAPEIDIFRIFKGCMIFMVIQLVIVILLLIFPDMVMWLPDLMSN